MERHFDDCYGPSSMSPSVYYAYCHVYPIGMQKLAVKQNHDCAYTYKCDTDLNKKRKEKLRAHNINGLCFWMKIVQNFDNFHWRILSVWQQWKKKKKIAHHSFTSVSLHILWYVHNTTFSTVSGECARAFAFQICYVTPPLEVGCS